MPTRQARQSSKLQTKTLFGKQGQFAVKTGHTAGTANPSSHLQLPPPPVSWKGTLPEWAIFQAHLVLGRREGLDFAYEAPLGALGADSERLDFLEINESLAIEIQGLYWHYEFQGGSVNADRSRAAVLNGLGFEVIFIDEDMALTDPVFYLREALAGHDYSRLARGVI